MTSKPQAPAAERNKQPILDVLETEFYDFQSVLKIGSGTGQHAVFFASSLPWLTWQTSDLIENHQAILSWIAENPLPNLREPIELDVEAPGGFGGNYDCVFSANTAHIMSLPAVRSMFDLVGGQLPDGGVFCVYGPFNQGGTFSSESNQRFDASLRDRNSRMGIRDLEELDDFAGDWSMQRHRLYAMPANNLLAVWKKIGDQKDK